MPQNLISAIIARRMLRRGCLGYLVMVIDTKADKIVVENVPVLCEFFNVFPKNCQACHMRER